MAEKFGRYVLEKKIGAGGMADVWLAQGPRGVCVVKVPHRHLCDNAEFIRMFLDEASLLAQLHHPNIAEIYDLGQVDGVYYLAMEYVAGYDLMNISLEHERQGELMAPELCARIVADAAGALHYAHEAKNPNGQPLNIIHRDVTPHNILLSRRGVVKIIDFGVAKASSTMHRTQVGFVKGKYPYMSPEQVTGQSIDRRVDVYALGLLLYELLTNVRAIPGNNEIEQIDNARYARIRPIEQLRPNVPVPIRQIIGGCLHFEVSGRYPTALAVKEDLEKFLQLQRQSLGQEDLLRLFRVVAADMGDVEEPESHPTELEQPISGGGAVVLPSNPGAKIDELGYSPTQPSMAQLKPVLPNAPPEPLKLQQPAPPGSTRIVDRHQPQSVVTAPTSKGPVIGLVVLVAIIAGLGVLLWEPWAGTADVADAGATVAQPVEKTVEPPPEVRVDAGSAVAVEPPPDAVVRAALVTVTSPVPVDVVVDGKKYGRTPIELELTAGKHRLVAGSFVQNLVLEPGETREVRVVAKASSDKPDKPPEKQTEPPEPAGSGVVKVTAVPFCALSVDGKAQGATSFKELELQAGPHTITCTLEDPSLPAPRVKKQKVTVTAGEQTSVTFSMLED